MLAFAGYSGSIASMSGTQQQQLEAAVAALQAQRAVLGDAVVDALVAAAQAQLATQTALPAQREQMLRQATVLFMDVTGSTPLSQHLEPEEFHALIDGVLSQGTEQVLAHGGKVMSYAGDNLIAVFGGTRAQEDAPEQAVRAALALRELGVALQQDVMKRFGHAGCHVRLGLHSGPVLLGGGVQAENTLSGLAVNVAARMEQTAPPGAIRISHAIYAQVRGVFDVEPQPAMPVKGLDEPMLTYLVQRAKPRAFRVSTRGIEGVETRMVGRERELGVLQDAFARLEQVHSPIVVTVVAEAGLGKSRLLYEFDNWAEAQPQPYTIFQARAHPQTLTQPYGMLREMLAWRFELTDDDTMEAAKTKLCEGISAWFADNELNHALSHAHLLGQLVGLDFGQSPHIAGIVSDARQIRNRAFHSGVELLRQVARRSNTPVVLQLDDLHWADDASLDFFTHVLRTANDVPMLMIRLTRPQLFERRPDQQANDVQGQRVELLSLSKEDSRRLANELLKRLHDIAPALRELVIGGAEGNPFYMEELVKMLIDQGAIDTSGEHWIINPDRLLSSQVPTSLSGVLQTRLNTLPATERLALQQASVIGMVFWDQALTALDPNAAPALQALVRRELVRVRPDAALDNMREYVFAHQILHQVTYETVLRRERRVLHARTADWLARLGGSRARDFLGATAEHYAQAGDPMHAAEFFVRAAEHAMAGYAHAATLAHVSSGLAQLAAANSSADSSHQTFHWRLLQVREVTLSLLGQREEQRLALDALDAVANTLNDDRRRADVAVRRSRLAMRVAHYAQQETEARRAMTLAEQCSDHEIRLQGVRLLAVARMYQGDMAGATTLARSGLEQAQQRGFLPLMSLYWNTLSLLAGREGNLVAYMQALAASLALTREQGDKVREGVELGNRGGGWLALGMWDLAERDLQGALDITRMVGDRSGEGVQLIWLSHLALRRNDPIRALELARLGQSLIADTEATDFEILAGCILGEAALTLNRCDEAAQAFGRARASAETDDLPWQWDAQAGLARVALHQGLVDQAMDSLRAVLDRLGGGGTLEGADLPRLIELTCYRALVAAGDTRAITVLARAHEALQRQAQLITDTAWRQSFLECVPEHRALVFAHSQRPRP